VQDSFWFQDEYGKYNTIMNLHPDLAITGHSRPTGIYISVFTITGNGNICTLRLFQYNIDNAMKNIFW